ncbi:GGDEF domain-containing protein, partial [Bacillus sp. AFS051223]
IPSILGGIYISKNIIYKNQLNVNKYIAYLLYSSNFAFWIFILKMLYIEINQVSEYGYLLSDVSLLFIAIAVDYFIVSSYQFIEFTVIPLLLG